jgi:enoyl-CoA hydratase/carnithine racemase
MDEARALARRLNTPLSPRHFKEVAYYGLEMNEPITATLMRYIYDQVLLSEGAKEGPRAFAYKRQPQWWGR